MDNPARASATELVAAIRRREIGSEELLDIYLERYRRLNGPINAVVATDLEEGALAELAVDTGDSGGPVGLTTRIDTVPTPAAQVFMETVRAVAEGVRG